MRVGYVLRLLTLPLALVDGGALNGQAAPEARTARLALQVDGMERARVRRDVVYRVVGRDTLRADVYLPERDAGPVPAVVFLSGATDTRSWAGYGDLGRIAAVHGLAAVHPAKRYERGQMASGADDIDELLAFLRREGRTLGVDGDRVCLWGFSGGGYLVPIGMRLTHQSIKCLINFYGGSDLRRMLQSVPDSVRRAMTQVLSGIDLIETNGAAIPPLLVARAGRDRAQLNAEIDTLAATALRKNLRLELINFASGQHGFDILDHTDESRAIIRRALQFARDHLGIR